jgi:hypothetical protein
MQICLTPEFLKTFDVVVFLNPTQDVLNSQQQKNFEEFMNSVKDLSAFMQPPIVNMTGHGTDKLTGAFFRTHPPAQQGTVIMENTDHPAMAPFKGMKTYRTFDEWYSFKENPRPKVHVLARLDETSLNAATLKDDKWKMGDHPLIWYRKPATYVHSILFSDILLKHLKIRKLKNISVVLSTGQQKKNR